MTFSSSNSALAVAACNKVVFGSRFAVAAQKLSCKKRAERYRGNTKPQRIVINYVLLTSKIGSDRKRNAEIISTFCTALEKLQKG